MIKVGSLRKKYPGSSAEVLCGVDLEVRAGGLAAVLGLSGAGKSTLLRCLVGLEKFDSGSISINGGVSKPAVVPEPKLVLNRFRLQPPLQAV